MARCSILVGAIGCSLCLHYMVESETALDTLTQLLKGSTYLRVMSDCNSFSSSLVEGARNFEVLELAMLALIASLIGFLVFTLWHYEVKNCFFSNASLKEVEATPKINTPSIV